MTHDAQMHRLYCALNDRKDAGAPVQFWLRDDDAVEPTKPLDDLLALTTRYAIPLTLAVIPALSTDELAQRLITTRHVAVAVHGWLHKDHAPTGEKKQELGLHRPLDEICSELSRGYTVLAQQHAPNFVPLLVPPWNRIDPAVVEELPELGFQGLSAFGVPASDSLATVNTHIDIIDWRGTRGCRDVSELIDELVAMIESTQIPIGILTHHLVHDDAALQFLQNLFSITSKHAGAKWMPVDHILPALSPHPGLPREEQS